MNPAASREAHLQLGARHQYRHGAASGRHPAWYVNGLVHHRDSLRKRQHARHRDGGLRRGRDQQSAARDSAARQGVRGGGAVPHDSGLGTTAQRLRDGDVDIRRPACGSWESPDRRRRVVGEHRWIGADRSPGRVPQVAPTLAGAPTGTGRGDAPGGARTAKAAPVE